MYEQVKIPKESTSPANRRESRAVANSIAQKKSNVKQGFDFVDNRPEAVAQRQIMNTIIQRQVDTVGGSFDIEDYKATTTVDEVGAHMRLKFTPNDKVVSDDIGMTQTVKTLISTVGNATPTPDLIPGRNTDVALADGTAIDQDAGNPMYAVDNSTDNGTLSSATDAGYGQNGWRKQNVGGFDVKDAILDDTPTCPITFPDMEVEHSFESTALVLEGPLEGTYLGSVNWGYTRAAKSNAVLDPDPITKSSEGAPSKVFFDAAKKWNETQYNTNDPVNLPISKVVFTTIKETPLKLDPSGSVFLKEGTRLSKFGDASADTLTKVVVLNGSQQGKIGEIKKSNIQQEDEVYRIKSVCEGIIKEINETMPGGIGLNVFEKNDVIKSVMGTTDPTTIKGLFLTALFKKRVERLKSDMDFGALVGQKILRGSRYVWKDVYEHMDRITLTTELNEIGMDTFKEKYFITLKEKMDAAQQPKQQALVNVGGFNIGSI